jgi:hypothetical protein
MEIEITIPADGSSVQYLTRNMLEDLLHDYRSHMKVAKEFPATAPETRFQHERALRAALLCLFAYSEGVANRWIYHLLDKRRQRSHFRVLEAKPLTQKINWLNGECSVPNDPNIRQAKRLRNLWAHFSPNCEGEAYANLSIQAVENTEGELARWMAEIEQRGFERHPDSEEILQNFVSSGERITRGVSSDPYS